MTAPQVPINPVEPPQRSDPLNYDEKADAMMIYIPPMVEGINEVATFVNEKSDESSANAITAVNAKNSAVATSNFKGKWSLATGQSTIPAAWEHNGILWNQNVNLASIQSSEPSFSNSNYTAIASYSTIQVENRLKENQNRTMPGNTGHQLPGATPRDYPAGAEFSRGYVVASVSTLVNLTDDNGVLSADSGIYTVQAKGFDVSSFAGIKTTDGRIVEARTEGLGSTGVWKYPSPTGFAIQISFTRLIELGILRGAHKIVGCSELPGVWPDVSDEESLDAVSFAKEYTSIPIGSAFPLATNIDGIEAPPVGDPRFRYIKLSSSDAYNGSILINEIASGTAPVLSVTAEINFPLSPIHGRRVELRNTSKVFSRAGENGGTVIGDTIRGFTGSFGGQSSFSIVAAFSNGAGIFSGNAPAINNQIQSTALGAGSTDGRNANMTLDVSRQVPTSNQNQPVHIEEPYFMRIF
jgi:hypothetical protein